MKKKPRTFEEMERYIRALELKVEELKGAKDLQNIKEMALAGGTFRKNDKKFQDIFEHSPLAIMYTDENGVITTCNRPATALFGAPKERLVSFSYKKIKDPAMKGAISSALSGGKSRFEGEYLTVTGNVLRNMNANFSPTFFTDGSVSGVIGIFEDITERIRVERERERCIHELDSALNESKMPNGFLPICSSCKKIKDGQGCWQHLEVYMRKYSNLKFSHSICSDCLKKLYPGYYS